MNYAKIFIVVLLAMVLSSCRDEDFTPINHHQSFVASMNILEPSILFHNSSGEKIAKWTFEKAYTGAVLLEQDRILLYGHQLTKADIYELSSGKKIKTLETGFGTTNAYYDSQRNMFFMTNSERNTVTSYNHKGHPLKELTLRNYPLSMESYDGKLYVVNYKDTILSVVDIESMRLEEEWTIPKSSTGMLIVPEQHTIWIGGHGEGSRPNQSIKLLDLETGQVRDEIKVSIMPVAFSRHDEEVYVANHGSNELYVMNIQGDMLWHIEVGANPFAVTYFDENIVVAGFDDHTLYFLQDGQIIQSIKTDKGPFQLLVREVQS